MVCGMCDMFDLLCIPYSGACEKLVICHDMLQYEQKLSVFINHLFQSLE